MSLAHDWYFDVLSPFAYLQWVRLRRDHPDLPIRPRPLLFGALLQHHGQLGPAEIPGKRAFTYRFVAWEARRLDIGLRFPPSHPFNPTSRALRLILTAPPTMRSLRPMRCSRTSGAMDSRPTMQLRCAAWRRSLGIKDIEAALARDDGEGRAAREHRGGDRTRHFFGVPTLRIGRRAVLGQRRDRRWRWTISPTRPRSSGEFDAVSALPVGIERRRMAS